MKSKLFSILVVMTLFSVAVNAQNKYGVGASVGFSRLTGDLGKNGGFGFMYGLEGKYYLTEKLAVGLQYNSNALIYKDSSNLLGVGTYGNRQILAFGQYYFTTGKVRPYAGLALGYSGIKTPEITITSGTQTSKIASEKKANLGIVPSVGLMIKNFGIEFAYNLSGKTPKSELQNVSSANKPFTFYTFRLKYVAEF
jgi:outer membrane protein W